MPTREMNTLVHLKVFQKKFVLPNGFFNRKTPKTLENAICYQIAKKVRESEKSLLLEKNFLRNYSKEYVFADEFSRVKIEGCIKR